MLEVRNLSKLYTQKDGTPVKALTDINISFPERGMVFLLGKSGSGKSTLLNICSGLDSPTSGEIIVKGRSSKDFSQSDFDSYRNTFVGFIFQEYNILNEFSAGDNISLALELQDKPKDEALIEKTLEDIGMKDFAHRRPNTLSGGEKQRIAIARALIKRPQIIMADEPSGALDSETGKQIFEILKKMSKDKLVIVVSHDREFAEQYGDRIIELKDGTVISDVSKATESQVSVTQNIEYVGSFLHIRNGALLNQKDFETLKSIFAEAQRDIVIAIDESDVEELKKSKNIADSGNREVFKRSPEVEKKEYKPEDSRFISSKLPFKHAVKIGVSSLKNKPIRLAFTSLLCIAAFTLFGLLSTMLLYNSGSAFRKSLINSELNVLKTRKEYAISIDAYKDNKLYASYLKPEDTHFVKEELKAFKSAYGQDVFGGVSVSYNLLIKDTKWAYWNNRINTIAYMTSEHSLYQTIVGTYPQNNSEICISSYMAQVLYRCKGYNDMVKTMDLKSPEDILGRKIKLASKTYTVTGIFDCGELPQRFDVLKAELKHSNRAQLLGELQDVLEDGLYFVVFTTEDGVKEIADKSSDQSKELKSYQCLSASASANFAYTASEYKSIEYRGFPELPKGIALHAIDTEITSLQGNEVIVYEDMFYDLVLDVYHQKKIKSKDKNVSQRYAGIESLCKEQLLDINSEQRNNNLTKILESLKQDGIELMVYVKPYDIEQGKSLDYETELHVVGFWAADAMLKNDKMLYVSDAVENKIWKVQRESMPYYEIHTTKYVNDGEAFYTDIFLMYDHSSEQTQRYSELYQNDKYRADDSREKFAGIFIDNLEAVDETVKAMSNLFLLIGVALAIFAALLLSNFISISISQKQKDIGILRAIGAKGSEIFKIFLVETALIVSACIVVATIASIVICNIINGVMARNIGAEVFVFSIGSFVLLSLISTTTALAATYFPVNKAAKRKPIDSIRII